MLGIEGAPLGVATLTLAEAASLVDGRVVGDPDTVVTRVAPIDEAQPGEMGFLAARRYARFAATSRASALLIAGELEAVVPEGMPCVVVDLPHAALRTILARFHPDPSRSARVHRTAVIERNVRLGSNVRIDPYAVIGEGVSIGDGTWIGAHCVIGSGSSIGKGCLLHPHVVTYADTVIGSGVTLHAGVRVGSDGFGYTRVDGEQMKIPQVGRAVIEDGVEVGANTTIDRGSLGDTVVGAGTKIDNLVQVAHNVRIGAGSLLAALVGIAGSTRIGRGVWVGGRASAINHIEIGDGARVAFGSTVMRDVPAGETVSGSPSRPHRESLRRQAHVGRLDTLIRRVAHVEAMVAREKGRAATSAGSEGGAS